MKKAILLTAISIIFLTKTHAQDTTKKVVPKQPKLYTLGIQVDSAGYQGILAAFRKVQIDLDKSRAPHDDVSQSMEFIGQLNNLFVQQKNQQDQTSPKKEQKPKK